MATAQTRAAAEAYKYPTAKICELIIKFDERVNEHMWQYFGTQAVSLAARVTYTPRHEHHGPCRVPSQSSPMQEESVMDYVWTHLRLMNAFLDYGLGCRDIELWNCLVGAVVYGGGR